MSLAAIVALSSAIASGSVALLLKYSTRGMRPLLVNYLKVLSGTLALGLAVVAVSPQDLFSIALPDLALIAFAGFTGPFVAWFLYTKALSKGDVSLIHPIVNTYPLSAMVAGYFIAGYSVKLLHVLGALLVITGVKLLVERRSRRTVSLTPVLMALAVSVIWGINTVLFKLVLNRSSPLHVAFLRALFALVFMTPLAVFLTKRFSFKARYLGTSVAAGLVSDFIGVFLWLLSLKLGEVSLSATISASAPIFSAVLSWKLFKEKMNSRRVIGIVLAVGGIVTVSVT